MLASSTSRRLTVGKWLGLTLTIYRTHAGPLLRTAAVFLFPVAVLSFFVDDPRTLFLLPFIVWPITTIANLSLISLCNELLHGRPLAVREAVGQGLRRLLAYLGLSIAESSVYLVLFLLLSFPVLSGLDSTGLSFNELRHTFMVMLDQGEVNSLFTLLAEAVPVGLGYCSLGVVIVILFIYLSSRWLVAQAALMVEGTGPLDSLGRSWQLSHGFVMRTVGYTLLLAIALGLVGGLTGQLIEFALVRLLPAFDTSSRLGLSSTITYLLSILTTPFYICAVVLYYFDLRLRKEKYDFEVVPQ